MDVQCQQAAAHSLPYNYLLDIIYGRHFACSFVLMMAKGRNLYEVIYAIKRGSCSIIIEYHAPDFDPPVVDAAGIERLKSSWAGV